MLDSLTEKFEGVFSKLKTNGKITEKNVDTVVKEIRMILLEADVNFKVVKEFVKEVKEEAIGQEVTKSVTPGQMFTKIIHDKLVQLMGGETKELFFQARTPNIVLVAGLQGTGKTTFCGKLALHYRKAGKRPLLVACDVHRPAAINQLETIAKSLGVDIYTGNKKDAVAISKEAIAFAKKNENNLVIIDTAGRLHVDAEMMGEVKKVKDVTNPDQIIYSVDSMTGQDAVNSANEFHDVLDFDGIVLTKMDADSKGGAALSAVKVTNKPIFFVSNGEKLNDLELFHPDRMAQRILGMGDVVSLVEKAQGVIDEKEAKRLEQKLKKNKFDLEDFLGQLNMIKKLGPLENVLKMIPGIGSQLKNVDMDTSVLGKIEAIILSMTPQERTNPDIIKASRKKRIAGGSGVQVSDVNQLLKQFYDMKKMMKQMNKMGKKGKGFGGGMPNMGDMSSMFGGKLPF